jgi:LPXTG-site transpeptidase (sortase) family protein
MKKKPAQSAVPKDRIVALYRQALLSDIPLETVDQKIRSMLDRVDTTFQYEQQQDELREAKLKKQVPLHARLMAHTLPLLCMLIGLFLVGNAAWPILSYLVFTMPGLQTSTLLAPIPHEQVLEAIPHVSTVQANTVAEVVDDSKDVQSDVTPSPTIVDTELDYINLSNWFPNAGELTSNEQTEVKYTLNIPSIDVHDAEVKVGGTNLDRSLIQYPGTAMPGELGAPTIFGHSILRQFYNPSVNNKRRYFSIFSKIMTLKPGDKIYIKYDNVDYTYVVVAKHDVQPEDTYILEQRYDVKHLKLVTCTPEGTTLHRGVVEAELVRNNQ